MYPAPGLRASSRGLSSRAATVLLCDGVELHTTFKTHTLSRRFGGCEAQGEVEEECTGRGGRWPTTVTPIGMEA